MAPSVSAYIESVLNSTERFRSLGHIFPLTDELGELRFTTDERSVTFHVDWNRKHYFMYCPFSLTGEQSMRLMEACTEVQTRRSPFITPITYRKSELLVFVTDICTEWKDVLLQEKPSGNTLCEFVQSGLFAPDRLPYRKLLEGLCLMAESFAKGGFVHGSLSSHNIYVSDNGVPVTINYRLSRSCNPVADCLAVARIAALVYLFGCDGHLWSLLGDKNAFVAPIPLRLLRQVADEADYTSIPPLKDLIHVIADISSHDMNKVSKLVGKLCCEPFRKVGRLRELLIMDAERESCRLRSRWPVRLPVAAAPCPISDSSMKVDFEECSWVGQVHDTIIRFEYGNRTGFADRFGWRLTDRMFLSAEDFYEGRARVQTEEGFGLINRYGDFVMEPCYEDLVWHGKYNVVTALLNGKWHLYDRDGRRLTGTGYDWMGECSEGYIAARRGTNYGFLKKDGTSLSPFRYDDVFGFRNGRAAVSYNGNYYHIYVEKRRDDPDRLLVRRVGSGRREDDDRCPKDGSADCLPYKFTDADEAGADFPDRTVCADVENTTDFPSAL